MRTASFWHVQTTQIGSSRKDKIFCWKQNKTKSQLNEQLHVMNIVCEHWCNWSSSLHWMKLWKAIPNVIRAINISWVSTLRNFKKFYGEKKNKLSNCDVDGVRTTGSVLNTFMAHMFRKKEFHYHNTTYTQASCVPRQLGTDPVIAFIHFCAAIM